MLSRKYSKLGILHEAKDWVMEVDVDQQLRFSEAICISTLRQDIVIYSLKLRKVILIELRCLAEENIEERHSEKISRYEYPVMRVYFRTALILIGKFSSLQ